jgi:hypothetical protein
MVHLHHVPETASVEQGSELSLFPRLASLELLTIAAAHTQHALIGTAGQYQL